jgi:hypothetical protein
MAIADWLEQHTSQAPAALRERVTQLALRASGDSLPATLAAAGENALRGVLACPGDRTAALDLLAADALVTLALLAQAETGPERLEQFATSILHTSRSDA